MKYEVELPGIKELTEKVVEAVADDVLHGDGQYKEGIRDKIGERAALAVAEKIEAEVARIVEEHLSATVQPTNELGEPSGPAITLRGRIAQQVKAWCDEKVDREGKINTRDGYRYVGELKTRAEWAVFRAVEEIANSELSKHVKAAAEETKSRIFGKVQEITSSTIKRVLQLP